MDTLSGGGLSLNPLESITRVDHVTFKYYHTCADKIILSRVSYVCVCACEHVHVITSLSFITVYQCTEFMELRKSEGQRRLKLALMYLAAVVAVVVVSPEDRYQYIYTPLWAPHTCPFQLPSPTAARHPPHARPPSRRSPTATKNYCKCLC